MLLQVIEEAPSEDKVLEVEVQRESSTASSSRLMKRQLRHDDPGFDLGGNRLFPPSPYSHISKLSIV